MYRKKVIQINIEGDKCKIYIFNLYIEQNINLEIKIRFYLNYRLVARIFVNVEINAQL